MGNRTYLHILHRILRRTIGPGVAGLESALGVLGNLANILDEEGRVPSPSVEPSITLRRNEMQRRRDAETCVWELYGSTNEPMKM